jgi:hypothetical protein
VFKNGGTLDYPLLVNFESDAYVNKALPSTLVTSTGEQLIFSGKNLSTLGVNTSAFIQSYPYVVNSTSIIATIPLGSVRTPITLFPSFTKVGVLDYGLTVSFTSSTFVNLGFTQDISSVGYLLTYTGTNLSDTINAFSKAENILDWTMVTTDTKIIATVPFYTGITKFMPSFNKVGNLDYGQEDTFIHLITSVTSCNKQLTVQGYGFNENTSFLLDGTYRL